jgi:hypothetical protein
MTAHSLPRADWRNNLKGMPIAAITEHGIIKISTGKDADAQSHIERIGERKQVKRGEPK